MGFRAPRHFRNTFADKCAGDDDLGLVVLVRLGDLEGLGNGLEIVAIDGHRIPALGGEILCGIFALSEFRHRVERHFVAVINENQVVQAVVAGKGNCLSGDTFLKAAVSMKSDHMMIKKRVILGVEAGSGALAGEREPNRVGDSLA